MSLKEFHSGEKAIVYEYSPEGRDGCLTEYFDAKKIPNSAKDRLSWLIELLCEQGIIENDLQFRHLEDGIWEFKPKNYRVLCFFLKGQPDKCVVTTNYYKKQTNKAPRGEIKNAKKIRDLVEKGG